MSDIIEYHMRPAGLGIILIELCVLLASNKKIHAVVPSQNHMIYDFKRIFNISDDQLTIIYQENSVNDPASNDLMKTFSPYFIPDTVTLFGRNRTVGRKNKPCIGLAMHHGSGLGEALEVKVFPFSKYSTYNTYSGIIKLITDLGYDVITFNSVEVDVEHKVFLLNELCECLIGYEGGTAHLAHMLKVPTIILPWSYWYDGETHWQDGSIWDENRIEAHKYHIDRKTYFLKSQEEILSWDSLQLKTMIESLHNNGGNNILFSDQVTVDLLELTVNFPNYKNFIGTITDPAKDFIRAHIQDPKLE